MAFRTIYSVKILLTILTNILQGLISEKIAFLKPILLIIVIVCKVVKWLKTVKKSQFLLFLDILGQQNPITESKCHQKIN